MTRRLYPDGRPPQREDQPEDASHQDVELDESGGWSGGTSTLEPLGGDGVDHGDQQQEHRADDR